MDSLLDFLITKLLLTNIVMNIAKTLHTEIFFLKHIPSENLIARLITSGPRKVEVGKW